MTSAAPTRAVLAIVRIVLNILLPFVARLVVASRPRELSFMRVRTSHRSNGVSSAPCRWGAMWPYIALHQWISRLICELCS